jgi:hypothetical protein
MTVVDRGFRVTSNLPNGQVPAPTKVAPAQSYDPKKARSLFDLKSRECRWPVRDNARGVADLFCGEAVAYEGCSYCSEHHKRSRQVVFVR